MPESELKLEPGFPKQESLQDRHFCASGFLWNMTNRFFVCFIDEKQRLSGKLFTAAVINDNRNSSDGRTVMLNVTINGQMKFFQCVCAVYQVTSHHVTDSFPITARPWVLYPKRLRLPS